MGRQRKLRSALQHRRKLLIGIALTGVVALAAALTWFQPWKLFIDHRVNDTLPAVAVEPLPAADVTSRPPSQGRAAKVPAATPTSTTPTGTTPPGPRLLSRGPLISHEHPTSGQVSVVEQPDGSRVLAIAHLDTSDGPDVHVWLTDARVTKNGWHVFDDGKYVSLGTLKGNLGNQVYKIPRSADLSKLTSISLWCARFDVSFGAAELVPVA